MNGVVKRGKMLIPAGLVLALMLGVPGSARACCPVPIGAAYTTVLNAYLYVFAEQIVAALGGLALDIKGHIDMVRVSVENAAQKEAEQNLFGAQKNAVNIAMANGLTRPGRECQFVNASMVGTQLASFSQAVGRTLANGVTQGIFLNRNMTPQRAAVGLVYRLCQNGQLTPAVFGPKWFTDNQCINDPDSAYAFLNPGTILDSPVLVMPTAAALDVLNNPETPPNTPASVAAVWNGLQDKEKKWVGAMRFCEILFISRARPPSLSGDAMMTMAGMASAAKNVSALARLDLSSKACRDEVERRTAPDYDADSSASTQNIKAAAPFIAAFLLSPESGVDPRQFHQYGSAADRNADTGRSKPYISPYLVERHAHDLCASSKNAIDVQESFGSDPEKFNVHLSCEQTMAAWKIREAQRRDTFYAMAMNIGQTMSDYGADVNAPVKIRHDGDGKRDLLREAALRDPDFITRKLRPGDLLQTTNADYRPPATAIGSMISSGYKD